MDKFLKVISFGLVEKKHLDFKNTINGKDYFFRGFRMVPSILASLLLLGIADALGDPLDDLFGLLALIWLIPSALVAIALGISTAVKRYRAVFPKWEPWAVYAVTAFVSIFSNGLGYGYEALQGGLAAASFAFSIYVLAKDTNGKHIG